jgi:hypothetical protein
VGQTPCRLILLLQRLELRRAGENLADALDHAVLAVAARLHADVRRLRGAHLAGHVVHRLAELDLFLVLDLLVLQRLHRLELLSNVLTLIVREVTTFLAGRLPDSLHLVGELA